MKSIDGTYARPSKITVYGGAKLKATNQTIDFAGPQGGFEVKENGVFSVKGTKYGYTTYGTGVAQRVDGLFDVQAPLCGTVGHWFVGSGRGKFKDTGSQATADYTIRLGEKVRFSAETFFKPIEVEGEPTLCSENGWEYAAGPLALPKGCVLTIDTQDPDTAEGYDCTFASAISGSGSLKVTGAGSLRLTAENSIGGAVTLDGGTLVVSKSQNFGSFSGRGTLMIDASDGEIPQLSVAGGFDLSAVKLGVKGLSDDACKSWITLAAFASGTAVAPLPIVSSDHLKIRYMLAEDGSRLLQVRCRSGIEIIVR
jgi:autotransporter-associated beta strand protein